MAGYRLYTGGPYKQRDGSAITSTSTDVDGGAAKNVGTNGVGLRNSALGLGSNTGPALRGGVSCGPSQLGSYSHAAGPLASGIANASAPYAGLALLNVTSHPFTTGSVVAIRHNPANNTGTYNGIFRVVAVPGANSVVLNTRFKDTQTGVYYATGVGSVASQTAGQYTIRRYDGVVHGIPTTLLRSAASDFGRRKVHSVTALQSTLVATAIRSGYFDIFTGRFDRGLTTQNDYGNLDTNGNNLPDDEVQNVTGSYSLAGEFFYRAGAKLPTSGDYEIKHT